MPLGGKLVLKGGETLQGKVEKKKKKKKSGSDLASGHGAAAAAEDAGATDGQIIDPVTKKVLDPKGITGTGKTYEEEFDLEQKRMNEGKARSNPWGSGYRAPPEILHGYDKKVTGVNAQERLDLRCAKKADKYCK